MESANGGGSTAPATPAAPAAPAAPATLDGMAATTSNGHIRVRGVGGLGGGAVWQSEPPPPPPAELVVNSILPPIDFVSDLYPAPSRGANLTLLVAAILESTVPSLQCYWGVMLVLWDGSTSEDLPSLQTLWSTGLLWTPVLFSASWSVADPWSETLCSVHGHTRLCSLVGALLVSGGLLLTAVASLTSPHSPRLPLLAGISAGIAAGVGASLVSRSSRLVLSQRWGARAPVAQGVVRFVRALGLTLAPLVALALAQRFGAKGALVVAAGLALHTLAAPTVLRLPAARPSKYRRLQDIVGRLSAAHAQHEADAEVQTESSDDGGSVSEHPARSPPPSNPPPRAPRSASETEVVTVVAEVHREQDAAVPQDHPDTLRLSPEATARLSTSRSPSFQGERASSRGPVGFEAGLAGLEHDDPGAPRPLYAEDGQPWNLAYSFDCEADDDIELFVKRLSPRRGGLAVLRGCVRGCVRGCGRGCRADLRPLLRPAFHLSLWTLVSCRLAALALAVLLPALAVNKLGARARTHLMAALPAVAGVGGLMFGVMLQWQVAADPGRFRRRTGLLSVLTGVAAAGFLLLSWGQSQWLLMLGSLAAGCGCSGAAWAQRHAARDALGGAGWYRAQPLHSFMTGIIMVFAAELCSVELPICMAIIAGMFAVISLLWLVQPFTSRIC